VVERSRIATKCGYGMNEFGGLVPIANSIVTSRSGCGTGSVRSTTAS
jgi:hypothetical protein